MFIKLHCISLAESLECRRLGSSSADTPSRKVINVQEFKSSKGIMLAMSVASRSHFLVNSSNGVACMFLFDRLAFV